MEKLSKEYIYAQNLLNDSGIDFRNISKKDILATCESYDGKINKNNYMTVLKAINDLYENIN